MSQATTGATTGATEERAVAERLAAVRQAIDQAATAAGRPAGSVTLVAVAKRQPEQRIAAAIAAGQRVFGENRLQEAQAHWGAAQGGGRRAVAGDLRLHFIGRLQSNKAAEAVALFDVIETVDRPSLAAALARALAGSERRPDLYVQVNIGEETQKGGIMPLQADGFIARCRDEWGLAISGLMCIPPADEPPAPYFALLREIARRNGIETLSMGMSGDFATAIACGATAVRVGRALFGERDD
ncbi:MAG: YggS family pyridoxal phosphate-dependent enzyme [Alphaproteobacteria bacterium]